MTTTKIGTVTVTAERGETTYANATAVVTEDLTLNVCRGDVCIAVYSPGRWWDVKVQSAPDVEMIELDVAGTRYEISVAHAPELFGELGNWLKEHKS